MEKEIKTESQLDIELRRACVDKIISVSYPSIDSFNTYMPLDPNLSSDIIKHADSLFKYIRNGK